jgi:medium-chain acyl-[acyl-carrier-protein] hydrolase
VEKIILFCIPHAGSSAITYNKWKQFIHNSIELCPIELAGRGSRYSTCFYSSIEDAAYDVYEIICKQTDKTPYAILGHSMGSVIAYELCHIIKKYGNKDPIHLFLSGRCAPHIQKKKIKFHQLPDKLFIEEIIKLGGVPKEFTANKYIQNTFIQILKADYRIVESYCCTQTEKIACDMTILCGRNEGYTVGDVIEWQNHTSGKCEVYIFDGGHFFIKERLKEVADTINEILMTKG